MSLLSDLGGPVFGLVSGVLNNDAAMDRQDAANAFSAQQYATRYQTTVKDMEAAGLNPMLAYSGISGSPPTGGIASSAGFPDLGHTFNASRVASAQVANIEADTANKAAQGALFEAQANAANASASQSTSQVDVNIALVDKTRQEVENLKSSNEQIGVTIGNLLAQRDKTFAETRNLDTANKQMFAAIAKLQAEVPVLNSEAVRNAASAMLAKAQAGAVPSEITRNLGAAYASSGSGVESRSRADLLGFDIQASKDMMGLGQDAKQVKPIIDLLRFFLRR